MSVPGRLEIGADGRVTGPAGVSISYNSPFPCVNGSYGSKAIQGVVMHTMVGNLPGTIVVFNRPSYQASAHFGIAQDGHIHQFGPIGKGWIAWAEVAGNPTWYSIEHADNGNTQNPLTAAQVTASAQLFEVLSRFAGFPLQVTDSVTGKGYGTHVMGGAAWGGHTCPGPGPRAGQRQAIVDMAKLIRAGAAPVVWGDYRTDGTLSLLGVAKLKGTLPSTILRKTVVKEGTFKDGLSGYINTGDLTALMPTGITLQVPVS